LSRISPSRFTLEHPWPYAVWDDRLSNPSERELATIEKLKAVLEKHWRVGVRDNNLYNYPVSLAEARNSIMLMFA
jgi:hypothetical protein